MMIHLKLIYFAFIYSILINKWIPVESSDPSPTPDSSAGGKSETGQDGTATPPPSSAGGGTVKTGQDSTATPPASSPVNGSINSNSSEPVVKLFGQDPNDANKTIEFNDQQYKLKKLGGNRIDYDLKADVKCTLITLDGKEFWKHGDLYCQDYPTTFSYRNGCIIVIYIGDGFVEYTKKDGNWKFNLSNNLKTTGEPVHEVSTPDPSEGDKSSTRTSGGTGTGGSTETSGGGTTPADGGSKLTSGGGTGTGDGKETGDGGSTLTSGGGPTSGGTGLTRGTSGSPSGGSLGTDPDGQSKPTGGSGPKDGGTYPGTDTGAAENAGKKETNDSSSTEEKSSSGCSWFCWSS